MKIYKPRRESQPIKQIIQAAKELELKIETKKLMKNPIERKKKPNKTKDIRQMSESVLAEPPNRFPYPSSFNIFPERNTVKIPRCTVWCHRHVRTMTKGRTGLDSSALDAGAFR